MNKKLKKLLTFSWLPILSTISYSENVAVNKNTTYWYDNLNDSKFEIRDWDYQRSANNGKGDAYITNNNYELKLLLNPRVMHHDEGLIKNLNIKFINKIKEMKLKHLSSDFSEIMPFVWFYFENEADRKDFVFRTKDNEEIFKFLIYKNDSYSKPSSFTNLRIPKPKTIVSKEVLNKWGRQLPHLAEFKDSIAKNLSFVRAYDLKTELYNNKPRTKIGVLEVWTKTFDDSLKSIFNSELQINELNNNGKAFTEEHSHPTLVSMVVGSAYGVDPNSQLFVSTFSNDSEWTKAIEQMVLIDGVRIINHSYSGNRNKDTKLFENKYDDKAYFLDYLTRKYGVINVMSAGNFGKIEDHLINRKNLSFNSLVVGALDDDIPLYGIVPDTIAPYSSYKLPNEFENLAKPLVVAPARIYSPVNNRNEYVNGTSFSAPLVSGLISLLLKDRPNINRSDYRVPIIKAILSAAARTPKVEGLKYKTSGFAHKYGSGIIDFIEMSQAADNFTAFTKKPNSDTGTVFVSKDIKLKANQTIKVASSWLFNAGILENLYKKLYWDQSPNLWTNKYAGAVSLSSRPNMDKVWFDAEKTALWLKKEETLNIQAGNWFTDYGLVLETLDQNGKWNEVKSITSSLSNDELLEFNSSRGGIYRYKVVKYSMSNFNTSVDDIVAVTHVVRNANK